MNNNLDKKIVITQKQKDFINFLKNENIKEYNDGIVKVSKRKIGNRDVLDFLDGVIDIDYNSLTNDNKKAIDYYNYLEFLTIIKENNYCTLDDFDMD